MSTLMAMAMAMATTMETVMTVRTPESSQDSYKIDALEAYLDGLVPEVG